MYDTYGPRVMFGGMGIVVFITMFIFYLSDRESAGRELRDTISRWWRNRQMRREARKMAADEVNLEPHPGDYSPLALDTEPSSE